LRRRIVRTALFEDCLSTLEDSPETRAVVQRLIERARTWPEGAPEIADIGARVLRSRPWGRYPAIRLLYGFEDGIIFLYHIENYDPLELPLSDV
jgi:hypothetical protein